MKDVECGNCGNINLVDRPSEPFKCGKCHMESDGYDMQLCIANEEIKILEEAVEFYALVLNWKLEYRGNEWSVIKENDCDRDIPSRNIVGGKRARQALTKLRKIRSRK